MIAALYVDPAGVYSELEGVDCWGEDRDARLYDGPHPVVAHPPCARWSLLAKCVEGCGGKKRGDDDDCFAAALDSVRKWGGVLEHPAYSEAWSAFGLLRPPSGGGWVRSFSNEWTCYVEQGRYGHPAKKATWLFASGLRPPPMRFGRGFKGRLWVTHSPGCRTPGRGMKNSERSVTPPAFRDALIAMARSAAKDSTTVPKDGK